MKPWRFFVCLAITAMAHAQRFRSLCDRLQHGANRVKRACG